MGATGSRSGPQRNASGPTALGDRPVPGRPDPRTAVLAVAHPGHELLLHGWLCAQRPRVCVLTDGSGRGGRSRLHATTEVLDAAGAAPGSLYGRFTDAAVYEWILGGDLDVFVGLAQELAKDFAAGEAGLVVGDAAEGYNPIHDAFRLTVDAAVALARRERPGLASYAFPLFGRPGGNEQDGALCIALGPPAREAKRSAARGYTQLEREVEWTLGQYGEAAFDQEWLLPVPRTARAYGFPEGPPVYERYGEHLVRSGQLERVIRYEQHLLPIARALVDAAGSD